MSQGLQAAAYSQPLSEDGTQIPSAAAQKARTIAAGLQARKANANAMFSDAIALAAPANDLPPALPDSPLHSGAPLSSDILKLARGVAQPAAALLETPSEPATDTAVTQRFPVEQANTVVRTASLPTAKDDSLTKAV
jgi:hypothetical protein